MGLGGFRFSLGMFRVQGSYCWGRGGHAGFELAFTSDNL